MLDGLPDELVEAISRVQGGGATLDDCLDLATVCCRLQRAEDHRMYTGNCHEPLEASELIVFKAPA